MKVKLYDEEVELISEDSEELRDLNDWYNSFGKRLHEDGYFGKSLVFPSDVNLIKRGSSDGIAVSVRLSQSTGKGSSGSRKKA